MYHAIESNAGGGYERLRVYAEDRSKHLHFPCTRVFLANQLNYHRLYRSSLSIARFRFTFLVIMHYYYYPRAVLQFTAIQRLSREDDDNAPLPGKRLNASRVR